MFTEKFAPKAETDKLWREFLDLQQGIMSVTELTGVFNDKSRFFQEYTGDPKLLKDHYLQCLNLEIREFIDPEVHDTLPKIMNRALKREQELQKKATEAEGKRKVEHAFSTPQSTQSKKSKLGAGLQVFHCPSYQPTSRRDEKEFPQCGKCGRKHLGECRFGSNVCYRCGKTGHYAANCQSSYRLCYYCYKDDHIQANCPKWLEDQKRNEQRKSAGKKVGSSGKKPKTRAYQITTEEAKESYDVVTGTFPVNSIPAHVLFDSGATRSFVSLSFCKLFDIPLTKLENPLEVEIADDKLVIVSDVYEGCNFEIDDEMFKIDLIPMHIGEFHVIVGMDWLGKNKGEILCYKKMVRVQSPSGKIINVYGEQARCVISVCTYAKAKRYLSHGCKAFLAHVIDNTKVVKDLRDIPVVNEFSDVFS
ncbi:uncharacterized protein [Rutidosis leptorrhynchoides]|uniref:uncharacterized protein n=1 Tax=Rutidosis leptorrhynchoides TaxID=125765 RepID=UPI003A995553